MIASYKSIWMTKEEREWLQANEPNIVGTTTEIGIFTVSFVADQAAMDQANRVLNTRGPNKIA